MQQEWLFAPATNVILILAIGILAIMVRNARKAIVRRLDHILGNLETVLQSQAALKTTADVFKFQLNKSQAGLDVPPV
jgi:hypothetical protein